VSVAIKIPLYNAEATILETLDSLLKQTYQDFFIYIYDNASSDSSIKLIFEYFPVRLRIALLKRYSES
jgi:glycosyltransferase involved in cell wall biosynthesis